MKPIKFPILHRFIEKKERQPWMEQNYTYPLIETEEIKEIYPELFGDEKMNILERLEKDLIKLADKENIEVNLDGKRIQILNYEVTYNPGTKRRANGYAISRLSFEDIEWITENYKEITEQIKELSKAAKERRKAEDEGRKEVLERLEKVLDTYEEE